MDFNSVFKQNKQKQFELIKTAKPFYSKREYNGEAEQLINQEYGFRNSYENCMSIDAENNPIPWMTYSSIFYLSQLDLSDCDIFEWGSGNSTLYFAKRAKSVTSIESNQEWYEYVLKNKPDNVDLNLVNVDNYAKIIQEKRKTYDIISIDGDIYRRFECAYYAVDLLKKGGMIIIDNSDWLERTTAFLRDQGFIQVDFAGLGPINNYMWCTSVFLSRDFNIKNKSKQPSFLKTGIKNERD